MKNWCKIALLLLPLFSNSTELRVRLFSSFNLNSVWVTTYEGDYFLVATDHHFNVIDTVLDIHSSMAARTLLIENKSGKVSVKYSGKHLGDYQGLYMMTPSDDSYFIIKGKGPERKYNHHLLFRSYKAELQVINEVELESYVAGVVESEGGHNPQHEYYKAQAVLARTWVMKNWNKHIKEGYNVKDNISSQAFNSIAYYTYSKEIYRAVEETKDTVLIDKNGGLVFGAFYSNSGGQTSNSEDIWSAKIDYLRSVKDTFSLKGDHAYWTKTVDKEAFVSYFAQKLKASSQDEELRRLVFDLQMKERVPWFYYKGQKLKMHDVRRKFKLRSSFFSVKEKGAQLVLSGRGFGHGVGLSQEGAMYMAEKGYCYLDILSYYFKDVRLKKLSEIKRK